MPKLVFSKGLWVSRNRPSHSLHTTTHQNGFSLVEVLVSVAIIGVVFGVIINSGAAIQRTSRDAQREADLKVLQGALQQFYADHQYFPGDNEVNGQTELKSRDNSKTYLKNIPQDPTGVQYCYRSWINNSSNNNCDSSTTPPCQYYGLYTNLETGGDDNETACGNTFNHMVNPL